MNIRNLRNELRDASNVLVLAPLTPAGNEACMDLLVSTPPEDTNLAAVTYTQPPDQWLNDWRVNVGDRPARTQFVHASGMAQSESFEEKTPDDVEASVVDPTDPMEIIVPLSEYLEEWTGGENQPVVSVQTLTVLLEYVDFDTAFRYLHILTHRVQAAGAVGYYQIDPDIHDPETVNTLKTLFDVVVEFDTDEREWTTTPTYEPDDQTTESTIDGGRDERANGPLSSIRTMLSGLFKRNGRETESQSTTTTETTGRSEMTTTTGTDGAEPEIEPEPAAPGNLADEEMLTDEERIRSLLLQYGGRMKQADITAETSWSKSTVSRKLSKMEENEEITRVQIGRGNLVFLNGSEPEASKPPFEA